MSLRCDDQPLGDRRPTTLGQDATRDRAEARGNANAWRNGACDDERMRGTATQEDASFYASLVIASEELSVDEITRVIGREPDKAWHRGDRMRGGSLRTWSKWSMDVEFEEGLHRGCYGLTEAIDQLDDDLADRAATLQELGCSVCLQVAQYIDPEDPMTDGIHIDEAAIAWLARAHASLDIDQYAQDATMMRAVRVWLDSRMWNVRKVRWFVRRRLTRLGG